MDLPSCRYLRKHGLAINTKPEIDERNNLMLMKPKLGNLLSIRKSRVFKKKPDDKLQKWIQV